MIRNPACFGIVCSLILAALGARGAEPKTSVIEGLKDFKTYIGEWRGIGQIKRGSPQGAWQEQATLVWDLKPDRPGIRFSITDGREWTTALLSFDPERKLFVLTAAAPDKSQRTYEGKFAEKRLVLEGADEQKVVHRITFTPLNENRLLVLFERRPENQSFFTRSGEVAYQRQGTKIAAVGGSGPICVVTGGAGTISVTHKGKTYYVCCTGCRDAFLEDPEGVLAAFEKSRTESR